MVREGRKHSESVRRGSAIGRECQNMRPEPGVAHQRSHPLLQTKVLEEADRDPELMTEERSPKKRSLTEQISIKNLEPLHQRALVPPKNGSPMNPFILGIPPRQSPRSRSRTASNLPA